jgi:hypothetical protein
MLVALLIVAFVMIATSMLLTYAEFVPFLEAVENDYKSIDGIGDTFAFSFKVIGHLPKLIPCAIDIFVMIFVAGVIGLGGGLIGAVTGLFGSNVLSLIIYYHTHIKHKKPMFSNKKSKPLNQIF